MTKILIEYHNTFFKLQRVLEPVCYNFFKKKNHLF